MHVLIAGGDRVDAGKTTFAAGFLRWVPVAARAYKPRAGNDYWFDHDDARAALADGRLHGKDVRRLLAAEGTDDPPATRNPVHRLWRPTPGRTGPLGEAGRTTLVDRVWDGDRSFVVNDDATIPDPVAAALPLSEARRVDSRASFDEAMEAVHAPALSRMADRIRSVPHAVVEAYANVATPVRGVAYDAVCVVEPTRVRIYDGDRWEIAREAATDPGRGRLEIRTSRVTELLDPLATLPLPPAPEETRHDPDRLAAHYDDAYSRLWDAADA
ncbi:MAG: ATPase [Halobaculum sp.]